MGVVGAHPVIGGIELPQSSSAPIEIIEQSRTTLSSDGDDQFQALVETDDGYLAAGQYWPDNDLKSVVARYADDGRRQWYNTYESGTSSFASDICRSNNQGYIVVGASAVGDGFNPPAGGWIANINEDGRLLWERTYPDESAFTAIYHLH
jgi:hypothetical protein